MADWVRKLHAETWAAGYPLKVHDNGVEFDGNELTAEQVAQLRDALNEALEMLELRDALTEVLEKLASHQPPATEAGVRIPRVWDSTTGTKEPEVGTIVQSKEGDVWRRGYDGYWHCARLVFSWSLLDEHAPLTEVVDQ